MKYITFSTPMALVAAAFVCMPTTAAAYAYYTPSYTQDYSYQNYNYHNNYNYNTHYNNNLCNYYKNGRCIRYTSNRYVAPVRTVPVRTVRAVPAIVPSYTYATVYPRYYYTNDHSRTPTYTTYESAGYYQVYDYNNNYNNNYNYNYNSVQYIPNYAPTRW